MKKLFILFVLCSIYVAALATGTNQPAHVASVDSTSTSSEAGHEWVDLGLPSGNKWATMNIGANAPEEYGIYFAWGEIEGKDSYSWASYKWMKKKKADPQNITRYLSAKNAQLNPTDDVAHIVWGGTWCMPTEKDLKELFKWCSSVWTDNYNGTGIAGRIFTSKVAGYTDRSIFFPAAGIRAAEKTQRTNFNGNYWTKSLDEKHTDSAKILYFGQNFAGSDYSALRYYGITVRAICK